MSASDYPAGTTVMPSHATWTVLPDGTANPSVGVRFNAILPSGRALPVNVEVALLEGEADQPWGAVCAAVFARAMAVEGLSEFTPLEVPEEEPAPVTGTVA